MLNKAAITTALSNQGIGTLGVDVTVRYCLSVGAYVLVVVIGVHMLVEMLVEMV
jgi:hypothetical protein